MKRRYKLVLFLTFLVSLLSVNQSFSQNEKIKSYAEIDTIEIKKDGGQIYKLNQEHDYIYYKPKWYQPLLGSVNNGSEFVVNSFRKENWPLLRTIAEVTAIMALTFEIRGQQLNIDQEIVNGMLKLDRELGINNNNRTRNISPIDGIPLNIADNFHTSLYYLGDGINDIAIAAGFFGYGLFAKDNRALQTSAQLTEGMIVVGGITQILKHMTGRQCPFTSTQAGGKWQWFPNQADYQNHVPHYDAFPSGHLATTMMMFTIIANNYPEKKYIWPLGGTVMTLLSLAMLTSQDENGGVHWMSDYPLAIAIGYGYGKMIVNKYRTKVSRSGSRESHPGTMSYFNDWYKKVRIGPKYTPYGLGIGAYYTF